MKFTSRLLTAAVIVSGALSVPVPAVAADPPAAAVRAAEVTDQVAADRAFVRWLSVHDPKIWVRSFARSALLAGDGKSAEAITTFLTSGYEAGAQRSVDTRTRNLNYATRMATTHPPAYYPWVNAAALRAMDGTEAELAEFVSTGYAAALAQDRKKVPYDIGASQVVPQDRDLIAALADGDLGTRVRARAARVVAAGTTDADVAEFLTYGWLSAANLDSDEFRAGYVRDERQWWATASERLATAEAADRVARDATGDAQAPARATAAQAWAAVYAQAAPAAEAWAAHEQTARAQADAWLLTSQTIGTAAGPVGRTVAAKAPAVRSQWLSEVRNATTQGAWWTALAQRAADAEAAWTAPVPETPEG